MTSELTAIIMRHKREHAGQNPTAITLGEDEWLALARDIQIQMLPVELDRPFTLHGVPIRKVVAPGIRVLE